MQEKIKIELKNAMLAKDTEKLSVIRMIMSAMTNELVSQGKPPTEKLSDDDVFKIIKKEAKKRKESIEQFTQAGAQEMAENEKIELNILENFLPAQMSYEEIESKIREKLSTIEIDTNKKGQLIGMMLKELGNTADGNMVKEIIEKILN